MIPGRVDPIAYAWRALNRQHAMPPQIELGDNRGASAGLQQPPRAPRGEPLSIRARPA